MVEETRANRSSQHINFSHVLEQIREFTKSRPWKVTLRDIRTRRLNPDTPGKVIQHNRNDGGLIVLSPWNISILFKIKRSNDQTIPCICGLFGKYLERISNRGDETAQISGYGRKERRHLDPKRSNTVHESFPNEKAATPS